MLITMLGLSTGDLGLFGPVYLSPNPPHPVWFKLQRPERCAQFLELTP